MPGEIGIHPIANVKTGGEEAPFGLLAHLPGKEESAEERGNQERDDHEYQNGGYNPALQRSDGAFGDRLSGIGHYPFAAGALRGAYRPNRSG